MLVKTYHFGRGRNTLLMLKSRKVAVKIITTLKQKVNVSVRNQKSW